MTMNRLKETGPSMTSETNAKEGAVDSPCQMMAGSSNVNHASKLPPSNKLSPSLDAFRCCNTPMSSPYGEHNKPVFGIKDTRSCKELGLVTPKLNDANTKTMVASSCRQVPASSSFTSVPTYQSKRSHSFAGVATDHVMSLGRRDDDTNLSNNPSLQYLITRARRGLNKPHSAHTSPLGGTMGRLQVKVDVSDYQHQSLARAVQELEALQAQQPNDDDSCIRQAIADVANHCLRQTREQMEQQETTNSTGAQTTTSRPKRNPSSEQAKRSPATSLDDTDPPRNKSRRLSSSTSFVAEAEAAALVSPGASQQDLRPPLRLPDPSNIVNRRQLLAMSRIMCSRSSIYSFYGESNGSLQVEDEEETEHCQRASSSSSPDLFQRIDGVADALLKSTVPAVDHIPAHANADDDDDADSFSAAASIMSVEKDDDSVFSVGPPPVAAAGAGDHNDEESIAFSMDSVDMRKKQFDAWHSSPQLALNQSTRTFHTDWAVSAQIQAPCVRAPEPVTPPKHIVCEFDKHVEADEESILRQRFQFQTRLWDDDEDGCSLASLQSLDTDPLEERMGDLVDPVLGADNKQGMEAAESCKDAR